MNSLSGVTPRVGVRKWADCNRNEGQQSREWMDGWRHESRKDEGKGTRQDSNDEIGKIRDWPKRAN